MRTLRVATCLVAFAPAAAIAQSVEVVSGYTVGRTSSELQWKPASIEGSRREGWMVGLFWDVELPGDLLRVRIEADLVQRGGLVSGDVEGDPLQGEIRGEYMSGYLQLKLDQGVGPLHPFVAVGLGMDQLLRTKKDPVLAQVLFEESDRAVNALVSAGLGTSILADRYLEVEVRWVEGLSPAFSGDFVEARNRSVELLLRFGGLRARPPDDG